MSRWRCFIDQPESGTDGQPVEQLGVRRRVAIDAEVGSCNQRRAKVARPDMIDATRAVSGFFAVSHPFRQRESAASAAAGSALTSGVGRILLRGRGVGGLLRPFSRRSPWS